MLEILLDSVFTHDSEWTRGYHVGYAKAMLHECDDLFTMRIPERHLSSIRKILGEEGYMCVYKLEPPNRFSVRFVHVRIGLLN